MWPAKTETRPYIHKMGVTHGRCQHLTDCLSLPICLSTTFLSCTIICQKTLMFPSHVHLAPPIKKNICKIKLSKGAITSPRQNRTEVNWLYAENQISSVEAVWTRLNVVTYHGAETTVNKYSQDTHTVTISHKRLTAAFLHNNIKHLPVVRHEGRWRHRGTWDSIQDRSRATTHWTWRRPACCDTARRPRSAATATSSCSSCQEAPSGWSQTGNFTHDTRLLGTCIVDSDNNSDSRMHRCHSKCTMFLSMQHCNGTVCLAQTQTWVSERKNKEKG